MKKSAIAFVIVAAFLGVLGALQIDRAIQNRASRSDSVLPPLMAASNVIPVQNSGSGLDFRAAAKKVTPSVVSVDRYQRVSRGFFDDTGTIAETGSGSGVVVSADGIIVTNNHVVQGAEQVKVRLPDKRAVSARVLGRDPRSDLAVLKIDAPNLVAAELGDSSNLEIGQWVMAVGNPLGFDNTVSVGVVSSLNRSLPVQGTLLINAIQTDAAINPGNSGGALADQHGRLVGINSAIASNTGTSVGIGFAIPVARVREVVEEIVKLGYVRYAGLGVVLNERLNGFLSDQDVRSQLSEIHGGAGEVPRSGIILKSPYRNAYTIAPNSSAARAGLQEWDVLISIDGIPTPNTTVYNELMLERKPGQIVTIKYWSKGQTKTAKVELQEVRST